MNRDDPSELDQSYFLPTLAVSSSTILRNSLAASNWTGEAKVSQRRRLEVVHDALERGYSFSNSSSLCIPCATETTAKLGKQSTELMNEIDQYNAMISKQREQNQKQSSLEQIHQEIIALTKDLSMFDEDSLLSYVKCSSLRNEIAASKLQNNSTIKETLQLDFDLSALDSEIINTLELIDSAAREINYLRGAGSEGLAKPEHNRVAPLFDAIECSSEFGGIASINRCRLSYAPNSHQNLNYSEINTAYVNVSVLLTCLRNAFDLPSINVIGVMVGSNSPFYSPAYCAFLQQQLNHIVSKGGVLSICSSRLNRLLGLIRQNTPIAKEQVRSGLILQLRPLHSKVLLRLLSPTGPTTATEDWLHLEAGVMTSFCRQTYSFKTSSKRNLNKVDWQGSGSGGSHHSGGSHTSCAGATAPVTISPSPSVNFFSNLLANSSVLFQSPVSSPLSKQKSVSTPPPPLPPLTSIGDEDQEAVVVESEQDDPVYRRAVVGLAVCVVVTALDVLLARQGVTPSQLLSMSTIDSFRILWSLITTHLKGCMMDVACALMTGVHVGFEAAMETTPNDAMAEKAEEFEIVDEQGRTAVMDHSVVTKLTDGQGKEQCRQESLFDVRHTRVSEMHELLMDMMITLKHLCSLE